MNSKNDNDMSNGIDFIGKGYATLPRTNGLSSIYSESNASTNSINKKGNTKSRSPSAAVGAVLDFMQALKESPILRRSETNLYSEIPYKHEDVTSPYTEKECGVNIIVSDMSENPNLENANQSLKDMTQGFGSKLTKDSNSYFPFVMISISLLVIATSYGFLMTLYSKFSDFSETNQLDEKDGFIHWLLNILGRILFKEKKFREN